MNSGDRTHAYFLHDCVYKIMFAITGRRSLVKVIILQRSPRSVHFIKGPLSSSGYLPADAAYLNWLTRFHGMENSLYILLLLFSRIIVVCHDRFGFDDSWIIFHTYIFVYVVFIEHLWIQRTQKIYFKTITIVWHEPMKKQKLCFRFQSRVKITSLLRDIFAGDHNRTLDHAQHTDYQCFNFIDTFVKG